MNYSSLPIQAYNIGHFLLAFSLLYIAMPRLLFRPAGRSRMDGFVSLYMRMVFFVILVGYVLLVTKLFESIGILGAVFAVYLIRRSRSGKYRSTAGASAMALFYDFVEAPYLIRQWFRRAGPTVRDRLQHLRVRAMPAISPTLLESILFVLVMGVSIYIRATDAVTNPAPAMSDGYVTLTWIKYVNERTLFHDGIYPQGMYFYLATLGKFAFINLLFVLKYSGPMSTILIVYGTYYASNRLTGRRDIGLVAALMYGVFGHALLGSDWSRQAATNSQEFGFVFVLPTVYFLHRYLEDGEWVDLMTAAAGVYDTGLTHPLAYILCAIGWGSVMATHFVQPGPFAKTRLWRSLAAGLLSAVVTLAPIALGFLLGHHFNSSASAFASTTTHAAVHPPKLNWADFLGVASILTVTVLSFRELARDGEQRVFTIASLFGAMTFLLYFLGGPVTHSVVLIARMLDLWAVVQPFVVAIAVFGILRSWKRQWANQWLTSIVLSISLLATIPLGLLRPIIPYKLQWNSSPQAYLHIDGQFKDAGYMLVASDFEYALVLGNGYRMSQNQFVHRYDPTKPPLTRYGQSHSDTGIASNVFVYYPLKIYEVSKSNSVYPLEAPIYAQERQNKRLLTQWLQTYQKYHPLRIYYKDSHLIVYEFTVVHNKKNATN